MGEIDLKQEVAITLNYDVKTQTDKILSVLFTGDYYAKGALHPINVSFSVNYDWGKNRELLLKDVIIESDEFMTKCAHLQVWSILFSSCSCAASGGVVRPRY